MNRAIRFAAAHQPIANHLAVELGEVERCFRDQLESDLPAVNKLCQHVERFRGKMLRPTLLLLSGLAVQMDLMIRDNGSADMFESADAWPKLTHSHRVQAAVCEMVHMSTLVHDDVLDEAELRRKGATINYLHGNEAAVLLGDFLISNAFHLCSSLNRPEINRRIGEVTNTLCSGELLQLHHREDWSLDRETYFEIIDRKTAALIGVCCELGAKESGGSDDVAEALAQFGRQLGIAFQIQDDLLDLIGDETVVGKTLGRDIEKGKLTLPLILCFDRADSTGRDRLLQLVGQSAFDDQSRTIRNLLIETEALDEARQVARDLVHDAQRQLDLLSESPAVALLNDLANNVIDREF
jgi:octaprenyl-diphosphate synthase